MKYSLMTWNTELYIYGNKDKDGKLMADINDADYLAIKSKINKFLMSNENAIVLLNEWPYKCNCTNNYHEFFSDFDREQRNEKHRKMIFNVNKNVINQIKMNVVVANEGLIYQVSDGLNNNIFVTFGLTGTDIRLLSAHPHDAVELYNSLVKLDKMGKPMPDIIVGDLNSGNYSKVNESIDFQKNKNHYIKVLEEFGYEDACRGEMTRRYIFDNGYHYYTPIDHILIKEDMLNNFKYDDVMVSQDYSLSDHCSISFNIITG